MKRVLLHFASVVALITPAYGQDATNGFGAIDFELASMAYSIDLSKIPASRSQARVAIFPDLLSALGTIAKQRQVDEAFIKFLKGVGRDLEPGYGFLIKVRILSDEFGNNSLPSDFLVPVGAGIDPLDAYSEYLNRPVLTADIPNTTMRDTGYMVWVEKANRERYTVGTIPRELSSQFIARATALARFKTELRAMGNPYLTFRVPDYVARAEYWAGRVRLREAALLESGRIAEAKALQDRFDILSEEHARLKELYLEIKARRAAINSSTRNAEILLKVGSGIADYMTSSSGARMTVAPVMVERYRVRDDTQLRLLDERTNGVANELRQVDRTLGRIPGLM